MPHALASALTFAVIPAGVALVGAVIAAFKSPSPRIRTYVKHFAQVSSPRSPRPSCCRPL